ncbi:MAG TPA: cysteine desulfurase family protein [Candidatus Saccharibacteria bacterium]|nr:cysteine desulfurase family protein [Candidatus Saccharibacteria bacterium]
MSDSQQIYLDYAAATPLDPAVLEAMMPYLTDEFYNPSASYQSAKRVRGAINESRRFVAHWLGVKPSEIIFTAGGTEANNLAINGVMSKYSGSEIIISSIEHESVREPANQYKCSEAPVDKTGIIDIAKLEKLITDKTALISVVYANNEIGTVQPLREIYMIIEKIRKDRLEKGNKRPLYLHTDACQAGNYLDLHVARLGVDFMTLNGGKIYGPKQSGALYVRAGLELKPLIRGGGQEQGLRSGTENVASCVGFGRALDIAQSMRVEEAQRVSEIRDEFIKMFEKNFPKAKINGSLKKRLPNNISVTFPNVDNERLMMQLDEAGIMCAVGSACSASNDEPSHVLKAIGLSDDQAQSTLRFTLGRQTTQDDLNKVIELLKEVING